MYNNKCHTPNYFPLSAHQIVVPLFMRGNGYQEEVLNNIYFGVRICDSCLENQAEISISHKYSSAMISPSINILFGIKLLSNADFVKNS